ncbi:hypothetical protein B0O99DRAFT_631895 [Bisporella sp. PMI_857]|nr:hypothetical protein B0O99DRAFT_631895 [Bisporella sp. PMI_857]
MLQLSRYLRILVPVVALLFLAWQFHDINIRSLSTQYLPTPSGFSGAPPVLPPPSDLISTHHEIFSVSSPSKHYFKIDFADARLKAINPNIIPHPYHNDTWIVVAQHHKQDHIPNSVWFAELVCNAVFEKGVLKCVSPTQILPIAATWGTKCKGESTMFGMSIGPHDARVFWGPKAPYVSYGSVSQHTCFGQWIVDFRLQVDWGFDHSAAKEFGVPTELQRPPPYGIVEKNYFLFWDKDGHMYAHYDSAPKRSFAKIEWDGSVGEDLAPLATSDSKCIAKYMPKVTDDPKALDHESIHQATNSLSITMCNGSDPTCSQNDSNTFLFTIIQHKFYYNFHSVYEPYLMVFSRSAPFAIHAISPKPLWISGRGGPGSRPPPGFSDEDKKKWNQTEMMYITSMSWKTKGQRYHGYLDDVLFVTFGIEDSDTGAIDVLAGQLLEGLALCAGDSP